MKKKVVWICDVKGWAYENITNQTISHLKEFSHQKVFISENNKEISGDIVICFTPKYYRYIEPQAQKKTIIRLDGFRAFGDTMANHKALSIENLRGWSWSVVNKDLFEQLKQYGWQVFRVFRSDENIQEELKNEGYFEVKLVQNIDGVKLLKEAGNAVTRMGGIRTFKGDAHRFDKEIQSCFGVIATNKELYQIAQEAGAKRIWLLPNGVNLEVFRPGERKGRKKSFTVGFAGNIGFPGAADYKGYDIAKAAAKIAGAKWKERLYGRNQVSHKEMVNRFFRQIDVLVMASENEGCNNTVMEALACGVPVLITKVGYHGDTIQDGQEGFFIRRDIMDIAEKIEILKNNRDKLEEMGQKARQFAEKHHDIKKIAEKYREIFEMIIREKGEKKEETRQNGKIRCRVLKEFWAYGRPFKEGAIVEITEIEAKKFKRFLYVL